MQFDTSAPPCHRDMPPPSNLIESGRNNAQEPPTTPEPRIQTLSGFAATEPETLHNLAVNHRRIIRPASSPARLTNSPFQSLPSTQSVRPFSPSTRGFPSFPSGGKAACGNVVNPVLQIVQQPQTLNPKSRQQKNDLRRGRFLRNPRWRRLRIAALLGEVLCAINIHPMASERQCRPGVLKVLRIRPHRAPRN